MAKAILKLIGMIIFWPSAFWLGFEYGWKLPVGVTLIGISMLMSFKAEEY